jgi:two-component sensor histidine kinase
VVLTIRAWETRQAQAVHELAVREIHHRLKNSLQMLSSLIRMRSSGYDDPQTRAAIADITSDLQAVAEVHAVLQNAPNDKFFDFGSLLQGICGHFRRLYQSDIAYAPGGPVNIAASNATALSIVINELLTNAMKHGSGRIAVSFRVEHQSLCLEVENSIGSVPPDLGSEASGGFGLRAIRAVIGGFGGTLSREATEDGGFVARVTFPLDTLTLAGENRPT